MLSLELTQNADVLQVSLPLGLHSTSMPRRLPVFRQMPSWTSKSTTTWMVLRSSTRPVLARTRTRWLAPATLVCYFTVALFEIINRADLGSRSFRILGEPQSRNDGNHFRPCDSSGKLLVFVAYLSTTLLSYRHHRSRSVSPCLTMPLRLRLTPTSTASPS